jgi:hypothetical protein
MDRLTVEQTDSIREKEDPGEQGTYPLPATRLHLLDGVILPTGTVFF